MNHPDYLRNRRIRVSSCLSMMGILETKANEISRACGAEVAVICFPTDGVPPLFHGVPSLNRVLDRRYVDDLGPRLNELHQALEAINLDVLTDSQKRKLKEALTKFRVKLAYPIQNHG